MGFTGVLVMETHQFWKRSDFAFDPLMSSFQSQGDIVNSSDYWLKYFLKFTTIIRTFINMGKNLGNKYKLITV